MSFRLFNLIGITGTDGNVHKCSFKKLLGTSYIKSYHTLDRLLLPEFSYEAIEFERSDYTGLIESGIVVFPFSKKHTVRETESYLNSGLKPYFMKPSEYKKFYEDYSESMCTVSDSTYRGLF